MPLVWKISQLNFKTKTIVSGVILNKVVIPNKEGTFKKETIFQLYKKRPFKNRKICVQLGELHLETSTAKDGSFAVAFPPNCMGELRVKDQSVGVIPITQNYPVVFSENDSSIAVISDMDDTLILSHTKNFLKRVGTLLFVHPLKRKSIGFTENLLRGIEALNGDIYYVSRSEANLFRVLSTFILKSSIPIGNLFLTPLLSWRRLVSNTKSENFKFEVISYIIENSSKKHFVLVGDDTQHDLKVYLEIAKKYPGNILKICIRKTSIRKHRVTQNSLESIKELGVPFLYFNKNSDWKPELSWIQKNS